MADEYHYKHTQGGVVLRAVLGAVVFVVVFIQAFNEFEAIPTIAILTLFIFIFLLFHSLTVTVTTDRLNWAFGIGVVNKSVALRDIGEVSQVRNQWWYGFGIRLTPHGWLYNVSGLDAVQIRLKSGKQFRIGTDQPDELLYTIQSRLKNNPV